MNIAGREISSNMPPYIVGEASCNHMGIFDNAVKLIYAAKEAGADAIKFQCYIADDMTISCDKPDFVLRDGPWKGRNLYELYTKASTPRAWFPRLFEVGKEVGITVFSSVFSTAGVDFLEKLGCPAYKIASMEITDTNLMAYAANTGGPIIVSTGMASDDEIEAARDYADILLLCTSGYPTRAEDINLWLLDYWKHNIGQPYRGISDHTLGWSVPVAATALGAMIIEKHLRLPGFIQQPNGTPAFRREQSEDEAFSLTPYQFEEMVRLVKSTWQAMQPSERKSEASSRQARRSLYVVKNIRAGEKFTEENVRSIRPAYGLPPKELSWVLASKAACNIERGTPLDWEIIDNADTPF